MKIELVLPEAEAAFIRYARHETLSGLGEAICPELLEPTSFAFYLIAYEGGSPIALAEIAMLDAVYGSFENSPYPASLCLEQYGPIEAFAGIRTIFIEPAFRGRSSSLYIQLILNGAHLVQARGARFGTATTASSNRSLGRLYQKTGTSLGSFKNPTTDSETTLFLFDIADFITHRAFRRFERDAVSSPDPKVVATLLSRSPKPRARCA